MSDVAEVVPIDPELLQLAADALKRGKITLMMQKNTVFYTTILFSLKQNFDNTLPTAATDGRHLIINPKFFMDLKPNERIGLLAHEILHVALDHMHRLGDRNPLIWNMAADYVINGQLLKASYTLPKGCLHEPKYDNMTTEQVYDALFKKTEQEIKNLMAKGTPGLNGGDIQFPEFAEPGQAVPQDEVTTIILRAATQAKAAHQPPGSIPGEVEIELERVINPPLPWHVILQNYMMEFAKEDYSFRRPNRRFLPNYYLPTTLSEAVVDLMVAVDTSGSVSDHEAKVFVSKIEELQLTMKPKKITVIHFDTSIKKVQELKEGSNPFKDLKFTGRGGTAITPVHNWIAENKPTVAIIFTDGDFTKYDPVDKTIPLVWLIHNNRGWTYPTGQIIHYDIDHR
jgi:predicted metal-dependent peptidase